MDTFVIVGGGLAAATSVGELRDRGFDGRLVLVGAEQHLPYERPPLSKGYLLGTAQLDDAFVHPSSWYADHDVELRLGTAVTRIDPGAHTVTTGQDALAYDRLLIATGARPRRLGIADDSGAPVAYLRTMEDSQRLKPALAPGRRIVVVGGGWIGLEVAAAARTAGADVVVLEALELPLVRVLGPEVAGVFRDLHLEHGVDVRTRVSVTGVARDGDRAVVTLADGSSLTADLLVVGVGVAPNSELAQAAGLDTDNGVLVDERLRASDPDVFAAGDVANAYHPALGRRVRLEHWDTAIEHGRTAARNMLGGAEPYSRLPYFFTDQYDLGIEYVGSVGPDGYDEVVLRGDVAGRRFTAFWVKDDRVVAGMHANDWDAIESVRRIVTAGRVDPIPLS
ncbi:MAG: FAD-dependent oxidoreductase [Cellulomonas sp. 73-145]|uniref:NAD(P)/FAD-dependent oxidoreductase n=1 Tax=Cellulomonas sp. 73-145 TaxID=1895739 RepID=UPI00092B8640|nr:FAD-dependent oxidoreductase [Cellulomonas sp. 73-145]OJV58261.1 MAG: FAD-dependent oxidoreductase [Cellulomonas sp. 73-145]